MKTLLFSVLMLALGACKPEPRMMSQLNFYEDSVNCKPIIGEDGKTYTKWDFDGDSVIVGCIKPVSELIHERDSLRKLVKRYRCEFETIQDAYEFLDSRDSICCDAVKVRSIELEEPKLFGGEVGMKLDQKTGHVVELMYKGKSYTPKDQKMEHIGIWRDQRTGKIDSITADGLTYVPPIGKESLWRIK